MNKIFVCQVDELDEGEALKVDCGVNGIDALAVFNNGDSPAEMEFQLPVEANAATDLLADTVGAENVMVSLASGRMKVQLPSNYATVLRLD